MADTPNHEYNVPDQGDQDWHNPLNENFEDFEVDIELRDQESNLGNYTPTDGAKFLATDTGVVYAGDGTNWTAAFVHPGYDDAADEAQFAQTVTAPEVATGSLAGQLTGGASLTDIAGNNLTISNGRLDASTGGGGGGISSLNGGDGIDPDPIGDGDTLSVAWGDANDLDSDGNVTGGSGGNWTVNNNLLEPSDSNVDGIDVDEVNTPLLETGSNSVTVTVGGARTLELTAEGGNTAGNVLTGHSSNSLDSGVVGATISGGGYDDGNLVLPNTITGNYGSIGGGFGNETTSDAATVAGGRENTSSDVHAAVGGGFANTAGGKGAAVSGGEQNDVYDNHGTVGGGQGNEAGSDDGDSGSDTHATVGGGQGNSAGGSHSTVGGGLNNTSSSGSATVIAGGENNEVGAKISSVGGGKDNVADGFGVVIGGGSNNETASLQSLYSAISGGQDNTSYAEYSAIGGGQNNQTGVDNDDRPPGYSTVGGGQNNTANAEHATVGGGDNNTASGSNSTVGGGIDNEASAGGSTIGGGSGNVASGGNYNTVGGGLDNEASGGAATVPGGFNNVASGGSASFAAGASAFAEDLGAFVWSDGSSYHTVDGTDGFSSSQQVGSSDPTGSNTFNVSASGGVRFVTGSNTVAYLDANDATWEETSTRAVKTNVDPVDPQEALDGVDSLEISRWEYEGEDGEGTGKTHVGPMAEEFHDSFDVGADGEDTTINAIDRGGVSLAAIQGLSEQLDDARDEIATKDDRIDEQQERIDDLEAENAELRERLAAVESRIGMGDAAAPADD